MKNGLLPTFYNKDNFSELKDDMVNFIQENIQQTKNGKLVSRKKIEKLNLIYYLNLCILAKHRYKGNMNRESIQKDKNSTYHPYYFLLKTDEELVIVFSGSSEKNDFLLDMKHVKQLLNNILLTHINIVSKILFHYKLIKQIQKYKGKKVTIVGHSLGAIIASYLLLILNLTDKKFYQVDDIQFKLYVFECPVCLPVQLQKYIVKDTIAVVNEMDPVVCFRGLNITPLFTVGGDKIYNFVKDTNGTVKCYQRDIRYFMNSGFFLGQQNLSVHRCPMVKKNILQFLEGNKKKEL